MVHLTAGGVETCAIDSANQIYCWGAEKKPHYWTTAGPISAMGVDIGVRCLLNETRIYCGARIDGDWRGFYRDL